MPKDRARSAFLVPWTDAVRFCGDETTLLAHLSKRPRSDETLRRYRVDGVPIQEIGQQVYDVAVGKSPPRERETDSDVLRQIRDALIPRRQARGR